MYSESNCCLAIEHGMGVFQVILTTAMGVVVVLVVVGVVAMKTMTEMVECHIKVF